MTSGNTPLTVASVESATCAGNWAAVWTACAGIVLTEDATESSIEPTNGKHAYAVDCQTPIILRLLPSEGWSGITIGCMLVLHAPLYIFVRNRFTSSDVPFMSSNWTHELHGCLQASL